MADWTLSAVMDGIAAYTVAQGITTTAYGYPMPNPTPPCLIVAYPTKCDFDFTFHGLNTVGSAELTFPLWFVVGRVIDKAARDALSGIISGTAGIKDKLDGGSIGAGVSSARVVDMKIEAVQIAGIEYLAAVFDLDVVAS